MKYTSYILLLFFSSCALSADIYQWRDEDGNLHYGDRPPTNTESKQVVVKVNSYQSVQVIYSPDWFFKREKKAIQKDVIMYSAEWCGVCKKAKAYFQEKNISFIEYDIDTSEKGKNDFAKLGGRGVPIVFVGNKQMNGFSPAKFEEIFYTKEP